MLERRITEEGGVYSHEFFLAAGECNAESMMPLPLLVNRLIRVATEHANLMNVGYARFAPEGRGWVLTKLAIEMQRYPRVNDNYTIKSWIEAAGKLLSFRNFAIYCNGEAVGYVRSEWAHDRHEHAQDDRLVVGKGTGRVGSARCSLPYGTAIKDIACEAGADGNLYIRLL